MKAETMVKFFEEYYGRYRSKVLRAVVLGYLQESDELKRGRVLNWTIGTYPSTYGKPPDVSIFEDALQNRDEWLEAEPDYGGGKHEPAFVPVTTLKLLAGPS